VSLLCAMAINISPRVSSMTVVVRPHPSTPFTVRIHCLQLHVQLFSIANIALHWPYSLCSGGLQQESPYGDPVEPKEAPEAISKVDSCVT